MSKSDAFRHSQCTTGKETLMIKANRLRWVELLLINIFMSPNSMIWDFLPSNNCQPKIKKNVKKTGQVFVTHGAFRGTKKAAVHDARKRSTIRPRQRNKKPTSFRRTRIHSKAGDRYPGLAQRESLWHEFCMSLSASYSNTWRTTRQLCTAPSCFRSTCSLQHGWSWRNLEDAARVRLAGKETEVGEVIRAGASSSHFELQQLDKFMGLTSRVTEEALIKIIIFQLFEYDVETIIVYCSLWFSRS